MLDDLRFGFRMLRRNHGYTVVAVLTLALGIGANTAIFSVIHAVLLNPLPYRGADRMVSVGQGGPESTIPETAGYLTIMDWKSRSHGFEDIVPFRGFAVTMTASGAAERVSGVRVGRGFFRMLGVAPALGRDFLEDEDRPERRRVAILSYEFWQRRFGGDRLVVGRVLSLDDERFEIVGVLPAGFRPVLFAGPSAPRDLWAPLGYSAAQEFACRTCQHLQTLAKLKPGVSREQGLRELNAVLNELKREHPAEYAKADRVLLAPLLERLVGRNVSFALWAILGAVGILLLIACANVANLALGRTSGRAGELAVRAAMGASRRRVIRLLLIESLALAGLAGIVGVFGAQWGMQWLISLAPGEIPRLDQVTLEPAVLLFTLAVSAATGVLCGIAPALVSSRSELSATLKSVTRIGSPAGGRRAENILVVTQVALAFLLITSGGLLLRSFLAVARVNPGMEPADVLSLRLDVAGKRYEKDDDVIRFTDQMLRQVRSLAGVESAAVVSNLALSGDFDRYGLHVQEKLIPEAEAPSADRFVVSPEYFRALRVPLKRGRLFTDSDNARTLPVAIVSEGTARVTWPGEDPIGKKVQLGGRSEKKPWITVVGVVGDIRPQGLELAPALQAYLPFAQAPFGYQALLIRSQGRSVPAAAAVRTAIAGIDPGVAVYGVVPMAEHVAASLAQRRFTLVLIITFAWIALILAGVGIYGVVSYATARRTREIGIRLALGAARPQVLAMVFRDAGPVIAIGLALGAILSLAAGRVLASLLFEVHQGNVSTLLAVGTLLAVSASAAVLVPARRASRIEPASVLRWG
jgi:putative ABC transport system permease protein